MSFTPFARYRNFTLANLKALLEVYPDMARRQEVFRGRRQRILQRQI